MSNNATTDTLLLNQTAMFEKLRAGLPEQRQNTQDLLECKDDILYAWDSKELCLLAWNWRTATLKGNAEVKYQTLIPSVPQNFDIDRILASTEGSLIALAGPRGVAVLELPRRWGKDGLFKEGKDKITCRTNNLDALLFSNNPHLEVRQLRWHPASPTDSHLLVLLSDNTLRMYDNNTLRHVWPVGPVPLKTDTQLNSSLPSAVLLGEGAVDFDIASPVSTSDDTDYELMENSLNASTTMLDCTNIKIPQAKKRDHIEWPIVILRENGNIYILMTGLDTHKSRLQGPLTITPQTADNYGLESCALLVIPSQPPTLVIAESSGKLHHAMLLDIDEKEESYNEVDLNLTIYPCEYTINVLETVELELGLPKEDKATDNTNKRYNCPIHLKRDFINELRYFAYHNAGLHAVSVNFIGELQRFVESNVDSDLSFLSTPSHAEYLVCTKIDTSEIVNAILGFVLLQMPSGVVMWLGSGQVISLKLIIDPKILVEACKIKEDTEKSLPKLDIQSELDQLLQPSFVDHIKNIMRRDVTQPLLSVDKKSNPSPQECYELLMQAIEVLRTQYIKRHEQVRAEIIKRVNTIKLRKEQQLKEIEDLERERENIQDTAHRLAERYEEISEQQEFITKKCQNLIREANTRLPNNPITEKEFAQEVERINKETKTLTEAMDKARATMNKQWYHICKYNETAANQKPYELPERQEQIIKDVLTQMTAEISSQIKEVKQLSKLVGV